jgi:hypothetical protein
MVCLYQAEMAALEGKTDQAKTAYNHAISTAARHAFLHDRALANERAGEFFLQIDDLDWATYYLRDAHQLYLDWGALAKAAHLWEKHANVLSALANGEP